MCGIVGVVGVGEAAPRLVESLKRLEYRGYDSAGIATFEGTELCRLRALGKLFNLEKVVEAKRPLGSVGIGHTRWATHGAPSVANAHPHQAGPVALVHNGIIENFRELKAQVEAQGAHLETETDSEVVAQMLALKVQEGMTPLHAVRAVLPQLQGAFALAILFEGHEGLMIGARQGSPLAVGTGDGEMYLGSDAIALAPFTNRITYLEDGDYVVVNARDFTLYDAHHAKIKRPLKISQASAYLVDKGNHRHFMAKEIHEQPEVVGHTVARYCDIAKSALHQNDDGFDFKSASRLCIAACGTAYLAGLTAKYWFERLARLPVDIDIASEFRYREMPLEPGGLSLFISQSGETADTLAALRYCRQEGQKVGAVVNVAESTIAREADCVFPTLAGPEIGVASTKAFTCQLAVLASLAIRAGRQRGVLSGEDEVRLVAALSEVPRLMVEALKLESQIEELSKNLAQAANVLYLGRGTSYPLALEGALKLKELSYIHAEAYAAGELKHGPIALVDDKMPVIVVAPHDRIFEKTQSNMEEVAARKGQILLLTDQAGRNQIDNPAIEVLTLPDMPATITPLIYAIPVQLLAYHTAEFMGTDVDQPRNLAKSVTVE